MTPSSPDPDRVYPSDSDPLPPPNGVLPRGPRAAPRFRERRPDAGTPLARWLVVGLFMTTAFLLGVFLDRSGWVFGAAANEPAGVRKTFSPFWEAWDLVREDYVDQKSVDPVHMTRGAIAGMLDSLGDEGHTTYLSPEDVKREMDTLQGSMEGIGARITVRDRLPTILMTMPNSPAQKGGLKAGDVLLAVDGVPVAREPLQQVVEKVRGPAGTKVKLTIHREPEKGQPAPTTPLVLEITRGKVEVPDVTWHMLPGESYAHIGIESFGEKADDQLKDALTKARAQGAKGVILDLRGNPGGLKDEAVTVTSEFLKGGDVFVEEDVHGRQTSVPVEPGGTAIDVPLVVLIDGGTASAAEICAGALQDHKRAELVGQTTFGTGTVLQPYELSDGSEILLATLKWLTPDKHEIWHKGITPDVEVALPQGSPGLLPEMEEGMSPESFQKSDDAQLLKALDILKDQAKKDK